MQGSLNLRVVLFAALMLSAVLGGAGQANAAVTIGSDLVATPNTSGSCSGQPLCTYIQTALPGRQLTAPAAGVVVRWRIKSDGAGGPFSLQVVRAAVGTAFTGLSSSPSMTLAAGGISVFDVRLPIQAGDQIGFNQPQAPGTSYARTGVAGTSNYYRTPALADGDTQAASNTNTLFEWLINADIEPDADGDGYGDESQDLCPTSAATFVACPAPAVVVTVPTITATASKRQRAGRLSVKLTSNETVSFQARATVNSKVKPKKLLSKSAVGMAVAGTAKTINLKFSDKTLKKLYAHIAKKRKLTATIVISAKNAAGNPATTTLQVLLKR